MNDTPESPELLKIVRNPAARTYLLISAGGLLATCLVVYLFFFSLPGAILLLLLGLASLGLRWTITPGLFVAFLAYFLIFPLGLPLTEYVPNVSQIPGRYFNFSDLLVVAAALVHLLGAYRYHSAAVGGMPFEAKKPFIKPGAKRTVRPALPIADPELWFLFARIAICVLFGQQLWMGFTILKVDFRKDFPIGLQPNALSAAGAGREYTDVPTTTSNATSRFLLAVGFFATSIFLVGTALWYWAKQRMNRDEAKAISLDAAWSGNRRFLNRPEAWRGWMKRKLAGTLPKSGCGGFFAALFAPFGFLILLAVSLYVLMFLLRGIFR